MDRGTRQTRPNRSSSRARRVPRPRADFFRRRRAVGELEVVDPQDGAASRPSGDCKQPRTHVTKVHEVVRLSKRLPSRLWSTLSALADPITLYVVYGVGSILAGKYRIERMIGEGGMGVVCFRRCTCTSGNAGRAEVPASGDMAMNQQMSERFLREARASALLKSEHIWGHRRGAAWEPQ